MDGSKNLNTDLTIFKPSTRAEVLLSLLPDIYKTSKSSNIYKLLWTICEEYKEFRENLGIISANNFLKYNESQIGFFVVNKAKRYYITFDIPFCIPPKDITIVTVKGYTDYIVEDINEFGFTLNVLSDGIDQITWHAEGTIGARNSQYAKDALYNNFGIPLNIPRFSIYDYDSSSYKNLVYETLFPYLYVKSIRELEDDEIFIQQSPKYRGIIKANLLSGVPGSHVLKDEDGNYICILESRSRSINLNDYLDNRVEVDGSESQANINLWNQKSFLRKVLSSDFKYRTLLKSLYNAIYSGPTLQGMYLGTEALFAQPYISYDIWRLGEYYSNSTNVDIVDIYEVLNSWDHRGITWNNQPSFPGTAIDYGTISSLNQNYFFDLKNLVTKWNKLSFPIAWGGYLEGIQDASNKDFTIDNPVKQGIIIFINGHIKKEDVDYIRIDQNISFIDYSPDINDKLTYAYSYINIDRSYFTGSVVEIMDSTTTTTGYIIIEISTGYKILLPLINGLVISYNSTGYTMPNLATVLSSIIPISGNVLISSPALVGYMVNIDTVNPDYSLMTINTDNNGTVLLSIFPNIVIKNELGKTYNKIYPNNNGIMLKLRDENTSNSKILYSTNSEKEVNKLPKLLLKYKTSSSVLSQYKIIHLIRNISSAWIDQLYPTNVQNSDNYIIIGGKYVKDSRLRTDSNNTTKRSYLKFDMSVIPTDAVIEEAKMILYFCSGLTIEEGNKECLRLGRSLLGINSRLSGYNFNRFTFKINLPCYDKTEFVGVCNLYTSLGILSIPLTQDTIFYNDQSIIVDQNDVEIDQLVTIQPYNISGTIKSIIESSLVDFTNYASTIYSRILGMVKPSHTNFVLEGRRESDNLIEKVIDKSLSSGFVSNYDISSLVYSNGRFI